MKKALSYLFVWLCRCLMTVSVAGLVVAGVLIGMFGLAPTAKLVLGSFGIVLLLFVVFVLYDLCNREIDRGWDEDDVP